MCLRHDFTTCTFSFAAKVVLKRNAAEYRPLSSSLPATKKRIRFQQLISKILVSHYAKYKYLGPFYCAQVQVFRTFLLCASTNYDGKHPS